MAVASEGFRMNRNLWTQIHQTEMFSPPLQVPSQGMDQSVIKINTKNDENKEVLHTAVNSQTHKTLSSCPERVPDYSQATSTPSPQVLV